MSWYGLGQIPCIHVHRQKNSVTVDVFRRSSSTDLNWPQNKSETRLNGATYTINFEALYLAVNVCSRLLIIVLEFGKATPIRIQHAPVYFWFCFLCQQISWIRNSKSSVVVRRSSASQVSINLMHGYLSNFSSFWIKKKIL